MQAKHTIRTAILISVLGCAAGAANGQQFSDNFDSGSLAAWGTPIMLNGPVLNPFVSAESGALRMSGLGQLADPGGLPEILVLPLASSIANRALYQNGSASIDVVVDSFSSAGMFARFDNDTETGVSFGISPRPIQGISALFMEVVINGVVTTNIFEIVPLDFSTARLQVSWIGDDFSLTVTNPAMQTASIFANDTSLPVGGTFALGTARSSVNVFEFGATFDNFTIVPAPGAAAFLPLGGLAAARRRR